SIRTRNSSACGATDGSIVCATASALVTRGCRATSIPTSPTSGSCPRRASTRGVIPRRANGAARFIRARRKGSPMSVLRELHLEHHTGAGLIVKRGQRLEIIDPLGEQVSDLVSFSESDPREWLSS